MLVRARWQGKNVVCKLHAWLITSNLVILYGNGIHPADAQHLVMTKGISVYVYKIPFSDWVLCFFLSFSREIIVTSYNVSCTWYTLHECWCMRLQLFLGINDTSQKLILRLAHNYGSATVLSKSGTCSSFKFYQNIPIPLKGYENPGKFATLLVVLSIFNSLRYSSIFLLLNMISQFVILIW